MGIVFRCADGTQIEVEDRKARRLLTALRDTKVPGARSVAAGVSHELNRNIALRKPINLTLRQSAAVRAALATLG